jgi:RNA polymerase sigma-70 factor, ECF subfamily
MARWRPAGTTHDGSTRGLDEPETEQDPQDIAASLDGDEAAYARLVRRYQQPVANQMWRFTRDRQVLDELVQEVFVEAYLSLANYKARAPFLHWLRRIATRVGYHHWKREGRERSHQALLAQRKEELVAVSVGASPREAAEYLHALLEQLPPKERLVLTLLYLDECDTAEIARRTGWTRTLVKVRAYRARKKLKVLLEQAGYGRT